MNVEKLLDTRLWLEPDSAANLERLMVSGRQSCSVPRCVTHNEMTSTDVQTKAKC